MQASTILLVVRAATALFSDIDQNLPLLRICYDNFIPVSLGQKSSLYQQGYIIHTEIRNFGDIAHGIGA